MQCGRTKHFITFWYVIEMYAFAKEFMFACTEYVQLSARLYDNVCGDFQNCVDSVIFPARGWLS